MVTVFPKSPIKCYHWQFDFPLFHRLEFEEQGEVHLTGIPPALSRVSTFRSGLQEGEYEYVHVCMYGGLLPEPKVATEIITSNRKMIHMWYVAENGKEKCSITFQHLLL